MHAILVSEVGAANAPGCGFLSCDARDKPVERWIEGDWRGITAEDDEKRWDVPAMTATGVSPASGTVFIIILIGRRQVMFAFACIIGSCSVISEENM